MWNFCPDIIGLVVSIEVDFTLRVIVRISALNYYTNKLMPEMRIACNIILTHIKVVTIRSFLLISNCSLLLVSLGFWNANIMAAKVSINKLMINSCRIVNGQSLFRQVVTTRMITIERLTVNWNSINFLTLMIKFLPYMIVFINRSNLPSFKMILELSIAEYELSMPILTPTDAARSTGVSSWKLPVTQDDSPNAFIITM